MHTRTSRLRSALLRGVMGLVVVLGLCQCGEPLIILDIDSASLPAAVKKLLLRTTFSDGAVQQRQAELAERGIAVHLPSGANGVVQIELFGLNEGGCTVAGTKLKENAPGGLGRWARRTVRLDALAVPLCPPALRSVVRMDATSVVVVGDRGTILRCIDTACSYVPSGTTSPLVAAWRHDATTFYAVGDGGTMLRCSTADNTCGALPAVVGDNLYRVWGDGQHVYAVGNSGAVLQCDTATTAAFSACKRAIPATSARIFGLWGTSVNIYLADTGGVVQRCLLGQPGIISCSTINAGLTDQQLYWAWGFEDFVYAVGAGARVLRCEGLTCTALNNGTATLNAVWGLSAGNVYAVGESGMVLRCVKQSCGMLPRVTDQILRSVWGDASNVYAVGDGGAVLRCAVGAPSCTPLDSHTTQNLFAVEGSDGSNVYAVGAGGTIMKCDVGGCSTLTVDPAP